MQNSSGTYQSDILCYNLDDRQEAAVQALALPGLFLSEGTGRVYPAGSLAASTLGTVGLSDVALGGLEHYADSYLRGSVGRLQTVKDARGIHLLWTDVTKLQSTRGADLILALDSYIQFLAEKELERLSRQYHPQWASIVVMEPYRGEVLAVANWPTCDPNHPESSTDRGLRNYAICEAFEPGSTVKPFTLAAALEGQFVHPNETFDCEGGRFYIYGRWLRDDIHAYDLLTVEEVLAHSSNIGVVKIAHKAGRGALYNTLRSVRFGQKTGVPFPGESPGLLRPLSGWQPASMRAIPIGQEMQTTSLALAAAYCAIANGGRYNIPKLILGYCNPRTGDFRPHDYPPSERVLSQETARTVSRMLTAVTEYGTGQDAQVKGFNVAGKTGTGQIYDARQGRYSREEYTASFVGFLPAEDPRVVIAVVVNRPKGAKYGGKVAAPAFARLAEGLMRYLEVFPSQGELRQKNVRRLFDLDSPNSPASAPWRIPERSEPATLMIGMTMREAYRDLRRLGVPLALHGSGVALHQEPRAMADPGKMPTLCEVRFFPPPRLSGDATGPETGAS
ncbi:MAG TPA: hypothetical protein ENN74_03370 [Firmicutes bacterium]|nr:hypothetical protein [Bacillota bacterium]